MRSKYKLKKDMLLRNNNVSISQIDVKEEIRVKEVMTHSVATVNENACIPLVALLMKEHNVGCIIITNDERKPVRIITEKDLVRRVLAEITDRNFVARVLDEKVELSKLVARDIMSWPLVTTSPDETIKPSCKKDA